MNLPSQPSSQPSLDSFNDKVHLGPTPSQLEFISQLSEWLDLSDDEVLEMAIENIPQGKLDGREVESLNDLSVGEASELIEDLKAKKTSILEDRREYSKGRRRG